MYQEKDIVHENEDFFVISDSKKNCYYVFESGITHATRVGTFAPRTPERKEQAIGYCDERARKKAAST